MWHSLIDEVRQQHAFLELFCKGWLSDYVVQGKKIHCGRGCSSCCTLAVNATFTEAIVAARRLTAEQETAVCRHVQRLRELLPEAADLTSYLRLHRSHAGPCPLLADDGSCGIYNNRPIACRSLLSTKESRWCATDFATLPVSAKEAFIADLDRDAVAFPLHYVATIQELGQDLEKASILRMRDSFGFSLYGSFPVLLFLARSGFDQVAAAGHDVVRQVLSELQLDHSFLVTIEK